MFLIFFYSSLRLILRLYLKGKLFSQIEIYYEIMQFQALCSRSNPENTTLKLNHFQGFPASIRTLRTAPTLLALLLPITTIICCLQYSVIREKASPKNPFHPDGVQSRFKNFGFDLVPKHHFSCRLNPLPYDSILTIS